MSVNLIIAILFFTAVLIFKDYKNWKQYYDTILFINVGELTYEFLFSNKLLWCIKSPNMSVKILVLIWLFITYPCTVLMFLSHYPKQKSFLRKIVYMFTWIILYIIMEYILYINKEIVYHNGWNFLLSCIFNLFLFPVLLLHHFKPLLSIILCSLLAIIVMFIFKVPLV